MVLALRPAPTRSVANAAVPSLLHATGTFANGRGRIDIDSSNGPMALSNGDYFVIDSGHTILVRPSVQTYTEVESPIQSPLHQVVAAMTNPHLVGPGARVSMELLESTETIASMPTRHYRIQSDYAMDLGARQCNTHVTTDLWIANVPFRFVMPVERDLSRPGLPATLTPLLDTIARYSAILQAAGAPLKVVTTTTYAVGGVTWDTMQSAEITDLRAADMDEGSFRIPDRYRRGDR
jgi:hypothetical protein